MADSQRGKITISIDKKNIVAIKELSETTRIPQSRLLDEAIEDLLKKYGK